MRILDIYQKYQIIPVLQQHQLRVAAVGQKISTYFPQVNMKTVVTACLLHDMGNILKIDFDSPLSKEALTIEQRKAGDELKASFQKKYGNDEYLATIEIVKEIGVSEQVLKVINEMFFTKLIDAQFAQNSLERKICEYADMRVDPYGVTSLEARLADIKDRYKNKYVSVERQKELENFFDEMRKIEIELFDQIELRLEDLNNQNLSDTIENLKTFEI